MHKCNITHRPEQKATEIFVVDDQQHMRDMIRTMLKNNWLGDVRSFDSAKLALGSMTVSLPPVDVVITDWSMPNMTGIELLVQIKSHRKLYATPVIMISDERTDDKVVYALEEGADGFLVKPFTESDLVKHVKWILATSRKQDPMQAKISEMRRLKLSGQYREALDLGYELMKIQRNRRVAVLVCECLYQVEDYDSAISIMSDADGEGNSSRESNLRGKIFMKMGQHAEALVALEEAVKMNPLNHGRKIDLAGAYFALGRDAEAEQLLNAISYANPTDMNLINIAELYIDRDDMDAAGKYLRRTVDPIKATVPTFNDYAIILRKAGRFEEADEIYRKCLRANPDSDVLHYNHALLHISAGKRTAAVESLNRALKLNPENEHAAEMLQRLNPSPATSDQQCPQNSPRS